MNEIRELTPTEVDEVSGGPVWFVPILIGVGAGMYQAYKMDALADGKIDSNEALGIGGAALMGLGGGGAAVSLRIAITSVRINIRMSGRQSDMPKTNKH